MNGIYYPGCPCSLSVPHFVALSQMFVECGGLAPHSVALVEAFRVLNTSFTGSAPGALCPLSGITLSEEAP